MIDHHVHIFSEASRALLEAEISRSLPPLGVDELLAVVDADHIERAAVLSTAYFFARPDGSSPPDAASVSRENDWVAECIGQHRDRLVGFFSVNPLHPSAVSEIERCAEHPAFVGLKLHLANSDVELRNAAHTDALATTFAAANRLGLVVVVHLRTRRADYGREDVEAFIGRALPEASHVHVQVAHLGGWGGYDEATDAAFGAFVEHVESTRPANLFFDLSAVIIEARLKRPASARSAGRSRALADKLVRIGLDRVLFGTDWPEWTPSTYVEDLRAHIPLSAEQITQIVGNRASWIE